MSIRDRLKDKKRVVIKIGSSSLTHPETGRLDLIKLEILVRELADLHNQGKEVIVVSSGSIAVGRAAIGLWENVRNTFHSLLSMGAIPVVNENDSISTDEIEFVNTFGDNDTLSALVAAMVDADLLILLSDIDGLFTDDPHVNPDAKFIDVVDHLDEALMDMGKGSTGSKVGTGGMATKLSAAKIATSAGADMVIANGADFHVIHKIVQGRNHGTLFLSDKKDRADLHAMFENL